MASQPNAFAGLQPNVGQSGTDWAGGTALGFFGGNKPGGTPGSGANPPGPGSIPNGTPGAGNPTPGGGQNNGSIPSGLPGATQDYTPPPGWSGPGPDANPGGRGPGQPTQQILSGGGPTQYPQRPGRTAGTPPAPTPNPNPTPNGFNPYAFNNLFNQVNGIPGVNNTPPPPPPAAPTLPGGGIPSSNPGTLLGDQNKVRSILGGPYRSGTPGPSASGPGNPGQGQGPTPPPPPSNPGSITAGFDQATFLNNGPYAGNAQANYDYWLNNPGAAGNPLAANASDLAKQGVGTWSNLPASNPNPYTGPLSFLSGQATQGSGPAPNGSPQQQSTYNTSYNPNLFASNDTAAGLDKWLSTFLGGGTYGVTQSPLIQGSPGSPFSFPNANWITGPSGQVANAGTIANMIQAFGGSPDMLKQLISGAFGAPQPTQTQQAQQLAQATGGQQTVPVNQNTQLTPTQVQQLQSGGQQQNPNSLPLGSGGNPQSTPQGLSASDLLSFLQSWSNLSGSGAPTAGLSNPTQPTNQLDPLLAMLFGGQNDLYQRQRNYPSTP